MTDQSSVPDLLKNNAHQVVSDFGGAGVELDYDGPSVEWFEGCIEDARAEQPPSAHPGLIEMFGSSLGQCIIECYGRRWAYSDDHGWGVRLASGSTVFPFAKVRKQLENGLFDGIAPLFFAVPAMMEADRESQGT